MRTVAIRHLLVAWLAIAAASVAFFPSPAAAQADTPPSSAQTPDNEATAAGAALFNAILVDSGATDMLFNAVRTELLPELRADVLDSPWYRDAGADRRRALEAFIETIPDVLRYEFTSEMGAMAQRSAPRMAALLSAQQMREIGAFLTSADMLPLWNELFADVLDPKAEATDFPDWSAHPQLAAFDQTDAGQAFARHRSAIGDILDEALQDGFTRIEPRMIAALMTGLCDALGDDCPADLRNAGNPI
jgi:hypothetical protein